MMVRANPLPVGRYWIFVQAPALAIFERWLQTNGSSVALERREDSGGMKPFLTPNESFFIFRVSQPTPWPRGVGFPNTADAATERAADVVQRPPPLTARQVAKDIVQTASEAATGAATATVVIGVLVVWALSRNR